MTREPGTGRHRKGTPAPRAADASHLGSAQVYEELVESAPDAMVVLNEASEIVLLNRQAENLFGYDRRDLLGQPVERLLPQRFHDRHVHHRASFVATPRARPMGPDLELYALHASGHEIPVEISLSPLQTDAGLLVASAIRDVSDRRALESELQAANAALDARLRDQREQLQGSELRYQYVFHTAAVGMARLALDGTFLDVNARACDIVGYDRDELMQSTFHDNVHPDDLAMAVEHADRLLRGEIDQYQLEKRYVRKDGSEAWVHHTRSLVRDEAGEPQYFVVVLEDVTARKRGEDRLRILAQAGQTLGSSLDFHDTMQRAASLMVPHVADWCVLDLVEPGRAGVRMVGVAHADPEKLGWARQLRERYPVSDHRSDGVGHVIRSGQSTMLTDVAPERLKSYARDDQHLRLLQRLQLRSIIITPLRVHDATIGALTLVSSNPGRRYHETDLRFAEEFARRAALAVDNARLFQRTQELNASLEARVQHRTLQVQQLASEITLAESRERGRIARLLHDDLQQQLHVLQLQLHELRALAHDGDLDAFDDAFGETARALRMGSATTRNLTTELSPVVLQDVDFAAALRWLGERFGDQHGLDVHVHAPRTFAFEHEALRGLVFSLVRECLFNVVKHAGVDHADVFLRNTDNRLEIEVSDQGRGFDPRAAGGGVDAATGFGLRSAHERLQLFGGSLRVDAEAGRGTRVTVSLPTAALLTVDTERAWYR